MPLNWKRAVVGGLVATAVMTGLMLVAPMMGRRSLRHQILSTAEGF